MKPNYNSPILPELNLSKSEYNLINERINEFKNINKESNLKWFSELCFCILTAQAQAKRALLIEKELAIAGYLEKTQEELINVLKSYGHRFHNNKARYIVLARRYAYNIKDILQSLDTVQAREFLVKEIKGIGYKEASHFLRNVGYSDVAIIDRHIIKFLFKYGFIQEIPKIITPKKYLLFENCLKQFNIPLDKLDLMIWCHMTGTILK